MVDNVHAMIDSTKRRITLSYHIALFMVGAVVILIAISTRYLVQEQINGSAISHLSGKQRMWSQRILLLSEELAEASPNARGDILQQLDAAVIAMERAHEQLISDLEKHDSRQKEKEHLKKIYFAPPLQLNDQIEDYLHHAHVILNLPVQDVLLSNPDMVRLRIEGNGRLLDSLTAAVQAYEDEILNRLYLIYHIVLGLSCFALFMLAVIALLVFRPAIAFVEQAQKRLIELNQLKGDFLANMSHEIRTPMNGIFGMTELLLDSSLNPRQQHYARTLQSSGDHLLGLINDILDFSKLEAGQMKLDPIRFNLLSTIEDAIELLTSRAREKNLELLLRYVPGTPRFVVADPGRIRQVLFNLIGNAIKFTDHGYVMVHVELLPTPQFPDNRLWLRLRIEDTGIGIPENKISSLFEKFMQVESGSTRARQGTGLGLAISRNLITLMEGHIGVVSHPGKGTVFTWEIPLADASDPQPSVDRQQLLLDKRVLLVDDLQPNRLLYKEALVAAGVECLTAENAEEAISILTYERESGTPVDAVVTDYMMPGIDGLRLTKMLKEDVRFSALPIVILSSAGEQGLIKRFDQAGANACLSKPATRQQLFDTLAHVLQAAARGETHSIITSEATSTLNARRLLTRERPLNGMHILLAEDNKVNLEITTEMLHQFGCEVTAAANGHEAIKAVTAQAFDLIFMDCQMPEMDGFEAAHHLADLMTSGQIAQVPIVALTANALKGDRERCLESGMNDYLSKPLRKANLEAILLKWLRGKLEARAQATAHLPVEELGEPLLPAPKPGDYASPESYGVDKAAFSAAQEILGDKLPTILSYYLEDAQGHIERIEESLARHDPSGAVVPAHTLKSSSKQLGVTALAAIAERIESTARTQGSHVSIEELASFLPEMRHALSQVRPFFQMAHAA